MGTACIDRWYLQLRMLANFYMIDKFWRDHCLVFTFANFRWLAATITHIKLGTSSVRKKHSWRFNEWSSNPEFPMSCTTWDEHKTMLQDMGVNPKIWETPQIIILIGFSIIFTIHFGIPLFLETPISSTSSFNRMPFHGMPCEHSLHHTSEFQGDIFFRKWEIDVFTEKVSSMINL